MALDILWESVLLGAKISLAAIPYSLVYTHLRMFNFAFGEVMTFAGYTTYVLIENWHWPLWAALCLALVLTSALGVLLERLAYRPLMETEDRHLLLVSSIGVSIALQNVYQAMFGSRTMYFDRPAPHWAFVLLVLGIEVVVLTLILHLTAYGDQVAGIASERNLAQLLGINPRFLYSSVFAGASALAVPASFFELCDNGIAPNMGFQLGLLAFAAAVLGGKRSLVWTVGAAFGLATLVQFSQVSSVLNDRLVWVLSVIVAILIVALERVIRRFRRTRRGEDTGR